MIGIDYLLWSEAFFSGFDGDGDAVLVAAADKFYVFALKAQVSDIYICRQVATRQVADVYRSIGIR